MTAKADSVSPSSGWAGLRARVPATAWYYATFVTLPFFGLVQTRFLTWILAPSEMGAIQLIVPLVSICFVAGGLGLPSYVLRFYASDRERVFREAAAVSIATSTVLTVVLGIIVLPGLQSAVAVDTGTLVLPLTALVLVTQGLALVKALIRAREGHVFFNVAMVLDRATAALGACLAVWLLPGSPVLAFLTGGAVLGIPALMFVGAKSGGVELLRWALPGRDRLRRMLMYGVPVVAVLLAGDLFMSLNRYVISASNLGPVAVAQFAVCFTVATLGMQAVYEPLLNYAHPQVFRAWEENRKAEVGPLLRRFFDYYLLLVLIAGGAMLLLEPLLIRLIADPRYDVGRTTFAVMLFANALLGVYRFAATYLLLRHTTVELAVCFLVALAASLIASIALVRTHGLLGVSIALAGGALLLLGLVWWRGAAVRRMAVA